MTIVKLPDGRQVVLPSEVKARLYERALDVACATPSLSAIEDALRTSWAEGAVAIAIATPPKPEANA